jgi:hypothetical protein
VTVEQHLGELTSAFARPSPSELVDQHADTDAEGFCASQGPPEVRFVREPEKLIRSVSVKRLQGKIVPSVDSCSTAKGVVIVGAGDHLAATV